MKCWNSEVIDALSANIKANKFQQFADTRQVVAALIMQIVYWFLILNRLTISLTKYSSNESQVMNIINTY